MRTRARARLRISASLLGELSVPCSALQRRLRAGLVGGPPNSATDPFLRTTRTLAPSHTKQKYELSFYLPSVILGVVRPVRAHGMRRNVVTRRPECHVLLPEGFFCLRLRLAYRQRRARRWCEEEMQQIPPSKTSRPTTACSGSWRMLWARGAKKKCVAIYRGRRG